MDNFNKDITGLIKGDTSALKGELESLTTALTKLEEKQKKLNESGKNSGKVYQTLSANIRIAKESISDTEKQIDSNTKALKLNSGSLQQNQALLESLTSQYNKVAGAKGKDADEAIKLNRLIGNLTSTIEDQEEKLNKSREAFDFQTESVDALKSSFSNIKDSAGKFAPALQSVSSGFNAMKTGLAATKTGFQSVGGAIKASGFGLLVLVLQSVGEYLTKNEIGQKYLAAGLAAIGTVVNKVKSIFEALGEAIFQAVINPTETIKSVWKSITTAITNQLKPFSTILEGLLHLNFSQVKQGFNQLGTNLTNIGQGIASTFKKAKDGAIAFASEVKNSFKDGFKNGLAKESLEEHKSYVKNVTQITNIINEANDERIASQARMSQAVLQGYAKEINDTVEHFRQLKEKYKDNKETLEQLKKEEAATLAAINKKFQDEDLKKLDDYHHELNKIGQSAREQAYNQLNEEYNSKKAVAEKIKQTNDEIILNAGLQLIELEKQPLTAESEKQIGILKKQQGEAQKIFNDASGILDQLKTKYDKDKKGLKEGFDQQGNQDAENKIEGKLKDEIDSIREGGHESAALQNEIKLLNQQHDYKIKHEKHTQDELLKINEDYAKKKADLENKLTTSRIHAGDKFIDAALKNTKKDTAIYKAAFVAKKAIAIADVVMSTKKSIIASFEGYAKLPFIGQALAIAQGAFIATQGAMSIAEIAKQKPGFARGGQYTSDGRGALLPGYSRTDNTNAYLRSGEAVVVSEAMRNPWARNLVSAINVAHGGRDFSLPNPGRGYAIGGIFTDGGNASRYYSQPMNDQKELANTLAYQMLNNFPPIYVDVKDVNNQQNILAQTVNRVNL